MAVVIKDDCPVDNGLKYYPPVITRGLLENRSFIDHCSTMYIPRMGKFASTSLIIGGYPCVGGEHDHNP